MRRSASVCNGSTGCDRHVRSAAGGFALTTAHQIDPLYVHQLADTGCLAADHNGGDVRVRLRKAGHLM